MGKELYVHKASFGKAVCNRHWPVPTVFRRVEPFAQTRGSSLVSSRSVISSGAMPRALAVCCRGSPACWETHGPAATCLEKMSRESRDFCEALNVVLGGRIAFCDSESTTLIDILASQAHRQRAKRCRQVGQGKSSRETGGVRRSALGPWTRRMNRAVVGRGARLCRSSAMINHQSGGDRRTMQGNLKEGFVRLFVAEHSVRK